MSDNKKKTLEVFYKWPDREEVRYRRNYNSIDAREMIRHIEAMKEKIPDFLYDYRII